MNNIYIDNKEEFEKFKDKHQKLKELDIKILYLRSLKLSYGIIQLALGNPSKKYIRNVLLEHSPQLINLDCNRHKL